MSKDIKVKFDKQKRFNSIVKTPDNVRIRTRELAEVRIRDNIDVDSTILDDGAVLVFSQNNNIFKTTTTLDSQIIDAGLFDEEEIGSLIKIRKSSIPDESPQAANLEFGEIALNYHDGKLYFKNADDEINFFAADPSVVSDDTLIGTGTKSDPLGVSFPVIHIIERINNTLSGVKILPYLVSVLRFDEVRRDFPNVSVYDRADNEFSVLTTE